MSPAVRIALGVELPPDIVARIRQTAPQHEVWTAAELERDPSGYHEAEIALITGWLEHAQLEQARRLRWAQTVGAGIERLLTPAIVARSVLGARELGALPRGAFVVNLGRGATIDTEALVTALRSGHLAGAGLDVTEPEPLPADHALWTLPDVSIRPHYSGAQPGYFRELGELFLRNIERYLRGEPLLNVVDKQAGY